VLNLASHQRSLLLATTLATTLLTGCDETYLTNLPSVEFQPGGEFSIEVNNAALPVTIDLSIDARSCRGWNLVAL